MTDPPDANRLESWQRFTLLDFLLLQAALVLGFSLSWSFEAVEGMWVERLIMAVAVGAVFGGPIVLSAQWIVRRRGALPSRGEQLWLGSFFCWTGGFFLVALAYWTEQAMAPGSAEFARAALGCFFCPLWITQTACSLWAFVLLLRRRRNRENRVPCEWTDRFGCAASLIFGLWLWHWPLMPLLGLA